MFWPKKRKKENLAWFAITLLPRRATKVALMADAEIHERVSSGVTFIKLVYRKVTFGIDVLSLEKRRMHVSPILVPYNGPKLQPK